VTRDYGVPFSLGTLMVNVPADVRTDTMGSTSPPRESNATSPHRKRRFHKNGIFIFVVVNVTIAMANVGFNMPTTWQPTMMVMKRVS